MKIKTRILHMNYKFHKFIKSRNLMFFLSPILLLLIVKVLFYIKIPWYWVFFFPLIFYIYYFRKAFSDMVREKSPDLIITNYIITMTVLAMVFAFLYLGIQGSGGGYLKYGNCNDNLKNEDLSNLNIEKSPNYYYFSILTLFSAGYGDICPMGKWMRILSVSEVIFGTLFNVIIMGFIIGICIKKNI